MLWTTVWLGCPAAEPPKPQPIPATPTSSPPPQCGDGMIGGDEACDDGAANSDDAACTSACAVAVCGDALVWNGVEGCDDGKANGPAAECTPECLKNVCGDGYTWASHEECDDGNLLPDDGCEADCARAPILVGLDTADAVITGEGLDDRLGIGATAGRDVDGDGFAEVFVGAPWNDRGGSRSGAAYVVHGSVLGQVSAADADAIFVGEEAYDEAGAAVLMTGDLTGDGVSDLVIGAPGYSAAAGAVYVVSSAAGGEVDLAAHTARLVGETAADGAGSSIGASDLDADGALDLVIATREAERLYVFHSPILGDRSLADADVLLDVPLLNANHWEVAAGGDWDGDGVNDLLVGGYGGTAYECGTFGDAYPVYGPIAAGASLVGDSFSSEPGCSNLGSAIAGDGDFNGDGLADMLLGVSAQDSIGIWAGAAYVVYGSGIRGVGFLADADVIVRGGRSYDRLGESVAFAGDLDSDGMDEILIGAPGQDEVWSTGYTSDVGSTYLFYGPDDGTFRPTEAGARLAGTLYQEASGSTVGAGDVDGDGVIDVMTAAPLADVAGGNEGALYVVSGARL